MADIEKRLIDSIWFGILLWVISYAASMVLFIFVPVDIVGWFVLVISIPVTAYVSLKRFGKSGEFFVYYLVVAVVWVTIAMTLDDLLLIRVFNIQNYYDLDVIIYYATTFLIPLCTGYKYGNPSFSKRKR